MNFLIVEDDENFSSFLSNQLAKYGKVFAAQTYDAAINLINSYTFDCAIIDLNLGDEILGPKIAKVAKENGTKHIIAVTYFENDEALIKMAYENGVDDFVKKSNLKTDLEFFIKKVVNGKELKKSVQRLTKTSYLTKDQELIESLENICDTYAPLEPIFIGGESGVGKTQLAKCLKQLLGISGELIELNCAGLHDDLIKSELFGHERGAFTGAEKLKIGKVELANNGILFLDEVGDMPIPTQEKLLKIIEEKEFTRVGGHTKIKSNFLLVTATLKNLEELVETGKLRSDFYNRIKGKSIHIRPLRERKDDIKLLINHFLSITTRSVYITPEAKEILINYSWPGNIRELSKVIYRLSDTKFGIVTEAHLKQYLHLKKYSDDDSKSKLITQEQIDFAKGRHSLTDLLDKIKGELFDYALAECEGNKKKVADTYQVSRRTIFYHLKDKRLCEAKI